MGLGCYHALIRKEILMENIPGKPTFIQLRERHHFDPPSLADWADVDSKTVYNMLMRVPVQRLLAEKVLTTLSKITGNNYTLDNVDVVLKD
jgi:hypothetical protein